VIGALNGASAQLSTTFQAHPATSYAEIHAEQNQVATTLKSVDAAAQKISQNS
jgi:hypothetical protein